MGQLREMAASDPSQQREELHVPRPMGFALPGPKDHIAVYSLLRQTLGGFSADAEIVSRNRSVNAVLFYEPSIRKCTVVCRGSADGLDLVTDAAAIPWSKSSPSGVDGAKVHLGFLARLRQSSLVADLLALHSSSPGGELRELHVTGHSMGGALGVLTVAKLATALGQTQQGTSGKDSDSTSPQHQAKMPLTTVTTFGCPRLGNTEFSADFDQVANVRHWRVQNGWDPITRVPFQGPKPFDFRHTGMHVWLRHGYDTVPPSPALSQGPPHAPAPPNSQEESSAVTRRAQASSASSTSHSKKGVPSSASADSFSRLGRRTVALTSSLSSSALLPKMLLPASLNTALPFLPKLSTALPKLRQQLPRKLPEEMTLPKLASSLSAPPAQVNVVVASSGKDGGVAEAAPPISVASGRKSAVVVAEALRGSHWLGHHQMGGARGYLASLERGNFGKTSEAHNEATHVCTDSNLRSEAESTWRDREDGP